MSGKIVCFGEIMMRLNPEGYLRFMQSNRFEVSYAGGEANVAVSLAQYGHAAQFVTKVPDTEIGQSAINEIRRFGVETGNIVKGGPRLGLYFVEKGASQRPSKVIYDRAGSSIAMAKRSEFDWEKILEGTDWFHFTGITPALGGECPDICLDACKAAKGLGITVSCDLNYRKKLWDKKTANRMMSELMPYVDVCIANEEDAADVFGIRADATDVLSGIIHKEGYVEVAQKLADQFDFSSVAITLRGSISASQNRWAGMLYKNGEAFFSPDYTIQIVDRVGGGDSFGGALIHGMLSHYSEQESINFAAAASCLKHTIEHDFNLMCTEEVHSLMNGNGSGRVVR